MAAYIAHLQRMAASIFSQLRSWSSSIHIAQDTLMALYCGVALGVVAVILLVYNPGDPIDYGTMADGSPVPEQLQMAESSEDTDAKQADSSPDSTLRRRKPATAEQLSPAAEISTEPDLDAAKIAAKFSNSRAAKLLGLTEEQVKEAVLEANKELREGKDYRPPNKQQQQRKAGRSSLSLGLDVVVYTCLLSALVYHLNRDYSGAASQFLQSMFPKEMQALGLGSRAHSAQ
eukprot:1930-Heterococcus_DN1.PRE.3